MSGYNDLIDAHLAKAMAAKEDAPVTVWRAIGSLVVCSGAGNVFDTYTAQRAAHIAANDPGTIEAFCAVVKAIDSMDACPLCGYLLGQHSARVIPHDSSCPIYVLYDAFTKK